MDKRQNPQFPDLGEFRMIRRFLSAGINGCFPGDSQTNKPWVGPGDDCACLEDWLITTDMSVEGTHFRLDWSTVEQSVEKCVLSNLSDINAMGAEPGFALISVCLNRSWTSEVQNAVASAFAESLERHKVRILGGDTVVGATGVFSLTLFGKTPDALPPAYRSAAKPGEFLYVSNQLGAPAAGLWALQNGLEANPQWADWVGRHRVPEVPLGLGGKLLQFGKLGACIDLSDGLSSELHHIALQSNVKLCILEEQIPVVKGLEIAACAYGFDPRKFWLDGGEEYQLLFSSAIPPSLLVLAMKPFEIHCIGSVENGAGVVMMDRNGKEELIRPGSWSHL